MKKRVAILGATGSIGTTALNIIRKYNNLFEVSLLANHSDLCGMKRLIEEFKPSYAFSLKDKFLFSEQQRAFSEDFLSEAETYSDSDIVINGIEGIAGLMPTLAAIESGAVLATANKESFVAAGALINALKKKKKAQILPLDSEHSAVFQCLKGEEDNAEEIILTASGGAFRNYTAEELIYAKAEDALRHPTWKMGKKVTVDCATLMNKGMEIIEAKHLFGVEKVSVVRHDESVIHSMVRMKDGSITANMSHPDMTVPIQYALTYPERLESGVKPLDFSLLSGLHFGKLNLELFPCLAIASDVNKSGDIAGCVMNAANEICVRSYIENKIMFYDIPAIITNALKIYGKSGDFASVEDVFCMDKEVREYTCKSIDRRINK